MDKSELIQILSDIGCNEAYITSFLECDSLCKCLKVLENKRRELLEEYHCAARRIDCLDYLVSEISKECDKND